MDKKKRAALAAVVEYLQTEAYYLAAEQTAAQPPVVAIPDRTKLNPWGLTGRNAQMQTRAMMQLRAFRS